ncbi:basic proline-rich protein-like [Mirounga leonina]|uniref:basic proline-rich protein-like n=1 Tax=Mirounga leonina TaxID=9715 RepID=UPI00156C30F8|nr:basic proline-rich protein-like [Mirounga leonina]
MPPAALELASAPALPPASRTSLRAAHTSSRQQPATEPQPSVSPPASPAARAEPGRGAGGQRGHQGRDGAAKQPRPGPRRLRNLNTHAHTRAHAGQSVRPEESEGAFTALHSFPKGEVPFTRAPPSRHPRRLQEGQLRHASSPPAHTPTPSRSSTIASVAPARGPLPPRLRTASPPRSPCSPPPPPPPRRSDLPRAARRAQPAGDATAEKRRQLPSPAASGATAGSREGAGGGGPRGRRRGRGAKVQAPPGPAAPPSPPTPAPAGSPPGTGSHRRRCLPPPRPPPPPPKAAAGPEREVGRWLPAGVGERERRMPAYLPGAAPGNFPEVRGEAKHLAGGIPALPKPPRRAHTVKAPVCLSVRPSSACSFQSGAARGRPDSDSWGHFFWAAGPCVPRGVRPPPASGWPQRHHPFSWSPVPEIPLHSLEPGREHASPGAADGQPFSRGPRRARRPEVAGTGGEGPPPLLSAGASGRLGRAPRSSNLPRLGALASSLSAWAAAAATEPGAPRGVRLCAASAGPDSLRQPRRCPRCPAGTRRGAGAPSQTSSRRSSPPPPPRLAPNLYLRSPSPTPEPLRLRLRGSAPSPAPQAPHPGRVNLTPRAQGGKVWE